MTGARVLISGMGGELGSYVAQLLETLPWVGDVVGLDVDPPRLRLRHAQFHRITPGERLRTRALVREVDPHMVVHLGVYEPDARFGPAQAAKYTESGTADLFGALATAPSLRVVVVRSGLEVYGRRRGAPSAPDETMAPDPTTGFGRSLAAVESAARNLSRVADVPVTMLRFAPLVGPHFSSPLGRYLRLPVVPMSAVSDASFSLLHRDDAARAVVAALEATYHGAVNIAGAGVVSAFKAIRIGGRWPLPVLGPGWLVARTITALAGAPLPEHLYELLTRGRAADTHALRAVLRMQPRYTTEDVVKDLFEWATVTHLPGRAAA
jgi:UDP-glucose 4-epimerase